jgi:hypothetical protein
VAATPGPRGPLTEAGAQVGIDWSVAYNQATLDGVGTRPQVNESSDRFYSNFAIFPRRLELRVAPVSFIDVGADLGWIDGGVDVRLGVPAAPSRVFAGNVAFGFRSGEPIPISRTRGMHSLWARLEAYPLLHEKPHPRGFTMGRAVLSLGVDAGLFYHAVTEPYDPAEVVFDGPPLGRDDIDLPRRELRIEAALGYHLASAERTSVLIAFEPYWVTSHDDSQPDYHQSWGTVLVLRLALSVPLHPARNSR